MTDRRAALAVEAAGAAARSLAARLEAHGYHVNFLRRRDPAVFKVTGMTGDPCVEVSAEDNGQAACHYTGRSTAEAAPVIARLPVPGQPEDESAAATVTATWTASRSSGTTSPRTGSPPTLAR
jgi:hypothetical protein